MTTDSIAPQNCASGQPSAPASLDCIPCLCRETVSAVRAATSDPALQDAILGEALFHLAMRDTALPPAELAADLQSLISQRTKRHVQLRGQPTACPHRSHSHL